MSEKEQQKQEQKQEHEQDMDRESSDKYFMEDSCDADDFAVNGTGSAKKGPAGKNAKKDTSKNIYSQKHVRSQINKMTG
eukprot:m.25172 g.25172  ORF g.25172 m.25172 type:complete len:79 (+) comp5733_c0_seq1:34-270(+)